MKKEETRTEEDWKFNFSGWAAFEHEMFENFGDAVTVDFSSSDPLSIQTDTNLLTNLQFTLEKEHLKFDSVFEVGEVFYGDATTGGNQGTRGKNIEFSNFNIEERLDKYLYFKIGWVLIRHIKMCLKELTLS